jgi:hypothetical protein
MGWDDYEWLLGKIERRIHQGKVKFMPWRCMGEWKYSPTIVVLGTSWSWEVSFPPRPHSPRGNRPRYPLDRRLGGPQSWSGRYGRERGETPWPSSNLAYYPSIRFRDIAVRRASLGNSAEIQTKYSLIQVYSVTCTNLFGGKPSERSLN